MTRRPSSRASLLASLFLDNCVKAFRRTREWVLFTTPYRSNSASVAHFISPPSFPSCSESSSTRQGGTKPHAFEVNRSLHAALLNSSFTPSLTLRALTTAGSASPPLAKSGGSLGRWEMTLSSAFFSLSAFITTPRSTNVRTAEGGLTWPLNQVYRRQHPPLLQI